MITAHDLIADPIGCYPADTVACFDPTQGGLPRRSLDDARCRTFLERLAQAGAGGVLIAASTGHGHLRTVDELAAWFRVAAEAELGDTLKMALLRPEDGIEANRRLLDLLAELEYRVIFVRPGNNLEHDTSPAEIAENMRPVVFAAAERNLAVGVYSIPDVSGLPMPVETVVDLLQGRGGDHLTAVKVTEADYDESTLQFLQSKPLAKLKIVQGWDPHLARALQDGPRFDDQGRQRCGVTSGPMSFAVFQYVHIFQAADAGDWEEVALAQQAVTALFVSMQDDPKKFADLQRAKYIMGLGHPLSAEVSSEQVERVFAALEGLARKEDQKRLADSLDLMGDGPFHERLANLGS
ncbi:dihydrodipicolinate synthase family protein [Lignipirellula cremea]|uniref:Dihydrodipicolinate synthase/N-acetylneuraminate lyase n=1 Tax=Lignipirellula cremea TaxID=2528010 RepID=A0A518E155_9BACT|nr:hypothetical protein [Lignipirellula cremea]QDU97820.1 hypothetical protein Pla8534_56770 [Lignipirellula cremea]